jgi:beta-lactamase regulating signal transducer with metallopeptidase domain
MIVWMLYSALVALTIAAAARAGEWLARLGGHRIRWIWAAGLALTMFLTASAALRETKPIAYLTPTSSVRDHLASPSSADVSWRHVVALRVENLRQSLDAPLQAAVAAAHRVVPPGANVYVALLAATLSLGVAMLLVGVGYRFRRARREWPIVAMQGIDVRLAPRIGPVVIGLVRPEIVVPRWLLARRADEQRLVVTHEDEHVRARDPLVLGLALGAVVIAPWNPAVWYMLSRLRLAVELDCDARVLRRGAAPRSYGALLIDVAQHASSLRLSALALADDSSHLHQRILAMKPSVPRFARLRGGFAAVFALGGVLVACQATLPTDAEIERMDVATATRTAQQLTKGLHADTAVAYTIDGAAATSAEAAALTPSELGRVQIVTEQAGHPTQINIATRRIHVSIPPRVDTLRALAAVANDSGRTQRTALMRDGSAGRAETLAGASLPFRNPANAKKESFTGMIFIDGVRSTDSQMMSLQRDQISSVEVIKGLAAARAYNDPAAANGVIVIVTKHGGDKQ